MKPAYFFNGGIHGEQYGDLSFISEEVDKLPISRQRGMIKRYSEIYQQLISEDPKNARYRVNTYLRKRVKKICLEFQKNNDNTLPF